MLDGETVTRTDVVKHWENSFLRGTGSDFPEVEIADKVPKGDAGTLLVREEKEGGKQHK